MNAPSASGFASVLPRRSGHQRALSVAAGLLYLITFNAVYRDYISVEWAYVGFVYLPVTTLEYLSILLSVGFVSSLLPTRISRPSYFIIWLMFALIFVPTQAITFMIGGQPPQAYWAPLLAFTVGLSGICIYLQRGAPEELADDGLPNTSFFVIVLGLFLLSTLVLIYSYASILSFAGIDDIYAQRSVATENTGSVLGYLRSYYGYFLNPLLLVVALRMQSKRIFIPLGLAGFLLSYMIDASKTSLVAPLVMLCFGLALRWKGLRTYHMTLAIAVLSFISWTLVNASRVVRFFADLVLLRTIAIPGQTFSQYYDVFRAQGYTWWSSVTGISSIVPPPDAFRNDPWWPVLGQIVGAAFFGADRGVNLNANPFVGEGVAAAGWFGILVISVGVAVFLRYLDKSAIKWDRRFVLMLAVPIGFALTNVHLSTFLVSFGGFAWLIVLSYCQPVYKGAETRRKVGASLPRARLPG